MGWSFSPAALAVHDAAHQIETAWEDSQPLGREHFRRYHQAVSAALVSGMPPDAIRAEANRLRSWLTGAVIPAAGRGWAEATITDLDRRAP